MIVGRSNSPQNISSALSVTLYMKQVPFEGGDRLAVITEGLCPICISLLDHIDKRLWRCSNQACQYLIGLCRETEDINEWACLNCDSLSWKVANNLDQTSQCPKCLGSCIRITEAN
jgi:hypothetical protein